MNAPTISIFKDKKARGCLFSLQNKNVVVHADKASNNIYFCFKIVLLETKPIALTRKTFRQTNDINEDSH